MTFSQAADFRLPFGKYKGERIDDVARTDDGLLYLDWLRLVAKDSRLQEALNVYLEDPSIAKELEGLS